MENLLRGLLIGLLFGMPIGAVGTMTVQRTLNYGIKAGLLTGLGSSAADCVYAAVGAFGLTLISDILLKYQMIINIIGGTFILIMGVMQIVKKPAGQKSGPDPSGTVGMFLSSFFIGITNPAAILTFIFAFSYFGLSAQDGIFGSVMIVLGVFIGTYIWWITVSTITEAIRKKSEHKEFKSVNKIFGVILIAFALLVFIKTFI